VSELIEDFIGWMLGIIAMFILVLVTVSSIGAVIERERFCKTRFSYLPNVVILCWLSEKDGP
jgi:hypothetical protein